MVDSVGATHPGPVEEPAMLKATTIFMDGLDKWLGAMRFLSRCGRHERGVQFLDAAVTRLWVRASPVAGRFLLEVAAVV